jgi:hypothetical protein
MSSYNLTVVKLVITLVGKCIGELEIVVRESYARHRSNHLLGINRLSSK